MLHEPDDLVVGHPGGPQNADDAGQVGAFVADASGFMGKLRSCVHLTPAIERLKSVGLLAPDATASSLRDVHIGRALTLGMFLGEVDGDLNLRRC